MVCHVLCVACMRCVTYGIRGKDKISVATHERCTCVMYALDATADEIFVGQRGIVGIPGGALYLDVVGQTRLPVVVLPVGPHGAGVHQTAMVSRRRAQRQGTPAHALCSFSFSLFEFPRTWCIGLSLLRWHASTNVLQTTFYTAALRSP